MLNRRSKVFTFLTSKERTQLLEHLSTFVLYLRYRLAFLFLLADNLINEKGFGDLFAVVAEHFKGEVRLGTRKQSFWFL